MIRFRWFRILSCLVAFSVMLSSAVAQRRARAFDTGSDRRYLGKCAGSDWAISKVGNLIFCDAAGLGSSLAASGVSAPGGMHVLSYSEALVSGRNAAGHGVVEHWRYIGGSLVLSSFLVFPGADFVGVVYLPDTGKLYLLDCLGNRILRGTWNGTDPLTSVSLAMWVDSTTVPYLSNSTSLVLAPDVGSGGKLLATDWRMIDGQGYMSMEDDLTGAKIETKLDGNPYVLATPPLFLNGLTVSEGATAVEVWAPSGSQVEVLDLDLSVVIGSGSAGSTVFSVPLTQPLVLGHRYVVRPVGGQEYGDHSVVCAARFGQSESFADGTQIGGVYYQLGARIGESFTAEVGLQDDTPPTAGSLYGGAMLVGFRIGGVDPIVPFGTNLLLASGVYIPASGFVLGSNGWGMAYSSIPIPNDPALVGLVFLIQFAMEDGSDYRLSQIYGAQILGASVTSLAGSGSAGVAGSGSGLPEMRAHSHLLEGAARGVVRDATSLMLGIISSR